LKSGAPPALMGPGHLVLHLAPLQRLGASIGIRDAADPNAGFAPMGTRGWNRSVNFDGVLLAAGGATADDDGHAAFTQVFRSGRIEAGRGLMVGGHSPPGPLFLSYSDSVPDLIEAIPSYVRGLARLGVAPPFVIMVSLLGVQGSVMVDNQRRMFGAARLDRDDLLFDPVVIETAEFADGWQDALRPLLEAWWNAYGWDRCVHLFGDDGHWKGYPRDW
jgi:hypothetical protein